MTAATKASHEQLPSIEKKLLYIQTSHPEVFCKTLFWKFLWKFHNSTCASVSFSIKLQAIGREHLFYGIFPDDFFCQISPWRIIQKTFEKFWKILMKTPKKTSLILIMTDTLDLKTLSKHNYTHRTPHSHEFWETCFVRGRSSWVSLIRVQNCSVFWILITEFNAINVFVSKREPYPEPCQTSKMERFVKIVNDFEIFDKVLNMPLISGNLL